MVSRYQIKLINNKKILEQSNFDIKSVYYFISRNIGKIIGISLIIFLIGCFSFLKTKPIYKATASILIKVDNSKSLDMIGLEGYAQKNILEDKIQILRSRKISESTIKNLISSTNHRKMFVLSNLKYESKGSFRKSFDKITSFMDSKDEIIDDNFSSGRIIALTNRLKNSIDIENYRETNLLNISYFSLNADEAAYVVNSFIDTYMDWEIAEANKDVYKQILFLEEQIKKKKGALKNLEVLIKNHQEKKGIYNVVINTEILLNQFSNLENDLIKNKLNLEDIKNRKIVYQKEINTPDIPKNYELEMKDSIRRVSFLDEIYQGKIEKITDQVKIYQLELDSLPSKINKYNDLERSIKIAEETYSMMLKKLDESNIMAESQIGAATVLDYAIPNHSRIKPNLFQDLILYLLIGIMTAVGLSALLEFFDSSIKTVDDLEKLGLSVLAIIPSIDNKTKFLNKKIDRTLILKEDPKSPISESYRTLRTSIMYSDTKKIKTIMVSSPGPGEGKTTTVANLAITYANLGKKILLIDTDLRKPVIDKIFDIKKEPGLTNYIVDDLKLDDIINSTEVKGLDVISSGIIPPNPSELLTSNKMQKLIEELKGIYDIILFDTPPIIAVTDALILSKFMDRFVLVCRSTVTQKGALDRVMKNLNQVNSNLDGVVLNALNNSNSYGSGYYYNYYQYYYGNDSKG